MALVVWATIDMIGPRDMREAPARRDRLARLERDRLGISAEVHALRDTDAPETLDELRERIQAVLEEHDQPGVGIALVSRAGVSWAGGVGVADLATGVEIDADTVFRVGSISKSVVALAVMALVEEGRLRLDAPVREIAPEIALSNAWAETDPITVAHVLEHTAGFDDMRFNESFVPGSSGEDPPADEPALIDVLARNVRSRVSRWRPGSRHAYANPGYTVAAYLIEKVTGEPFERYVERRILRPMGMDTASFTLTPALAERLAQGYGGWHNDKPIAPLRLYHRPAGELMASPRELAHLVHLFLRRGRTAHGPLIDEASIARMERGQTRAFPKLAVGYGLGTYGDTTLPAPTRGHDGGLPGFLSEYRYADELGVGWALLFNSTGDDVFRAYWRIRSLVFAYLTRDMSLPEPPEVSVPRSELARCAGFYALASPRHELTGFLERALSGVEVFVEDDGLYARVAGGEGIPLVPTGGGQFRVPGHSGALLAFATRADGTKVLAIGDAYYEEGEAFWVVNGRRMLLAAVWLMDVGVCWIVVWLPGWLMVSWRLRQRFPLPPDAVPSLASICFVGMQKVLVWGAMSGALGEVSASSVGFFVLSVVFPVLAGLALLHAVRDFFSSWLYGAVLDGLVEQAGFYTGIYANGWYAKLFHLAVALACAGMAVYLTLNGITGLRTWAW